MIIGNMQRDFPRATIQILESVIRMSIHYNSHAHNYAHVAHISLGCREQTSDAESEGEILTLTSQLSTNNHRCLQRSRLLNNFGNNQILDNPIDERILRLTHPTKKDGDITE
uniref:PDEase domain-containing protein n=1 Tax=Ascaris lumbricoides TaxID=6252 RepID=A0A0M3HEX0_ASCLU